MPSSYTTKRPTKPLVSSHFPLIKVMNQRDAYCGGVVCCQLLAGACWLITGAEVAAIAETLSAEQEGTSRLSNTWSKPDFAAGVVDIEAMVLNLMDIKAAVAASPQILRVFDNTSTARTRTDRLFQARKAIRERNPAPVSRKATVSRTTIAHSEAGGDAYPTTTAKLAQAFGVKQRT